MSSGLTGIRDLRGGLQGSLRGFADLLQLFQQIFADSCLVHCVLTLSAHFSSLPIIMSTQSTSNSQSTALDAVLDSPSTFSSRPDVCVASTRLLAPVTVSAPLTLPDQPSPASHALAFAASGVGFSSSSLAALSSSSQGRPNLVVPTFVSMFSHPIPSHSPLVHSLQLHTSLPSHAFGPAALAQPPLIQLSFVVGPLFSPIAAAAKLVNQIVARKFVKLCDLLSSNIVLADPEPQLLFDGRMVLTPPG